MADNRRTILANLATTINNVTEVVTTVRTYTDIDVLNYKEAELPLVVIREPLEDTHRDMTSYHSIMLLSMAMRVWFVSWAKVPTGTYETLMKKIRDAIGANFNLNDALDAVWIDSITALEGEMPVYYFDISLQIRYYLNQKAT